MTIGFIYEKSLLEMT